MLEVLNSYIAYNLIVEKSKYTFIISTVCKGVENFRKSHQCFSVQNFVQNVEHLLYCVAWISIIYTPVAGGLYSKFNGIR